MGSPQGPHPHPSVNLTDPGTLKKLLERHGLQPTKRFGQHFLVSERVVSAIVEAVGDVAGVLEVGPGPGVLTARLSEHRRLIALEVDPVAVSVLSESAPKAEVRHQDALRVDLGAVFDALPGPTGLVSNMPYNITGPLLTLFCAHRSRFVKAVLMMQREVAERILAPAGDSATGSLGVMLQTRFEIHKVCDAPPGCFWPPPKVDSTVLCLVPRVLEWTSEEDAWHERVVRTAFTQPRKTLANNLLPLSDRAALETALTELGIDLRARPHQIRLDAWRRIATALRG